MSSKIPPTAQVAAELLSACVAELGGAPREAQETFNEASADAMDSVGQLLVDAPTGTGKTLAYLCAAAARIALHDDRVVVSTEGLSLQQQLIRKDLPVVAKVFEARFGKPLIFAEAKGRNNYLCRSVTDELRSGAATVSASADVDAVRDVLAWEAETETGDRNDAPDGVDDLTWSQVSVTSSECSGDKCRLYDACFAERASASYETAQLVVTNHHLLLIDAAIGAGRVLGPYDTLVVDEAHQLAEIATNVFASEVRPGALHTLSKALRSAPVDDLDIRALAGIADDLRDIMSDYVGKPMPSTPGRGVDMVMEDLAGTVDSLRSSVQRWSVEEGTSDVDRKDRLVKRLVNLRESITKVSEFDDDAVRYVDGTSQWPSLRVAQADCGPVIAKELLRNDIAAILCSATFAVGRQMAPSAARLGLKADDYEAMLLDSPFDYQKQGVLYVAKHLPDPNSPQWRSQAWDIVSQVADAAQGRTLMLCSSWRNVRDVAEHLRATTDLNVLVQRDASTPALVRDFTSGPGSVLVGTRSFYQGLDFPGDMCRAVIIDKIPFPHPDDPLIASRLERAGREGFRVVNLPLAAVALGQAAGRLIRRTDDTGAVVVLDSRLATKSYRQVLLETMPPLKRTIDLQDVLEAAAGAGPYAAAA